MVSMTTTTDKVPTQFITDSTGERIAVILPIAVYEQIKPMLETVVDPELDDEGEIRPEVRRRLMQQLQAVKEGERGIEYNEAMATLEMS